VVTASLRDELLRLVQEDHDFRAQLRDRLGDPEVRAELIEIRQAVRELAENQKATDQAVRELAQNQKATDQAVRELAQNQKATDQAVRELAQNQKATDQAVRELAQNQKATDQAVRELAQNQKATDQAVRELAAAQRETQRELDQLTEAVAEMSGAITGLRRDVGGLSETIGFTLEDVARTIMPGWLERHLGVSVDDLEREFFTTSLGEEEVDLYARGRRNGSEVTLVGEAKARLHQRDVQSFSAKLERLRGVIAGEVVPVMVGFVVHPRARAEGHKAGIHVVASYDR
jgi:SMC interacting uncharacterized protein involved in chromosome segregation